MNAGIADAANLAWLLAARLEGWGGEGILTAYAAERLPITDQVSHFAMDHAHAMTKARKSVSDEIEADGPEADAYRAAVGKTTYDLNVQQYCCAGLNFGYFYQGSPIIVYDGEAAPPYTESSRHRRFRAPSYPTSGSQIDVRFMTRWDRATRCCV